MLSHSIAYSLNKHLHRRSQTKHELVPGMPRRHYQGKCQNGLPGRNVTTFPFSFIEENRSKNTLCYEKLRRNGCPAVNQPTTPLIINITVSVSVFWVLNGVHKPTRYRRKVLLNGIDGMDTASVRDLIPGTTYEKNGSTLCTAGCLG